MQCMARECRAWPCGVRWCYFPTWPRSIFCCNSFNCFTNLVLVGCPRG
nr:MAG TPA: Trefoil (P-type) domain [Caudoviricetes sp.]